MEHSGNNAGPLALITQQPVELIRADASDYFQGYPAIWYDGTPATEYRPLPNVRERITPSAFNDVVSRGDHVEVWYNHDSSHVLGSTQAQSLFLETDARGLKFTVPYDDKDPDHVKVKAKLSKGIATGASFQALATASLRKQGDNYIRSIDYVDKLREVSIVNHAAYVATEKHLSFEQATLRAEIAKFEATRERIIRAELL